MDINNEVVLTEVCMLFPMSPTRMAMNVSGKSLKKKVAGGGRRKESDFPFSGLADFHLKKTAKLT